MQQKHSIRFGQVYYEHAFQPTSLPQHNTYWTVLFNYFKLELLSWSWGFATSVALTGVYGMMLNTFPELGEN